MDISYAILLDGGFIRAKLGNRQHPLLAPTIQALVEAIGTALELYFGAPSLHLHRAYFYDAKPLDDTLTHPLNGKPLALANTPMARNNRALHKGLERVPFLALRYGHLKCRGWGLHRRWIHLALKGGGQHHPIDEADVVPQTEQKGVDMRIGLDIASLALKKQVSLIVLVTADSDFVPAMKFARREGVQLCLARLGHGVTEELLEHADLDLEIDLSSLKPHP